MLIPTDTSRLGEFKATGEFASRYPKIFTLLFVLQIIGVARCLGQERRCSGRLGGSHAKTAPIAQFCLGVVFETRILD